MSSKGIGRFGLLPAGAGPCAHRRVSEIGRHACSTPTRSADIDVCPCRSSTVLTTARIVTTSPNVMWGSGCDCQRSSWPTSTSRSSGRFDHCSAECVGLQSRRSTGSPISRRWNRSARACGIASGDWPQASATGLTMTPRSTAVQSISYNFQAELRPLGIVDRRPPSSAILEKVNEVHRAVLRNHCTRKQLLSNLR